MEEAVGRMGWMYTHVDEITREDMEIARQELEELAKTRELDFSESEILRMAREKEPIAVVQMMIAHGL